MKRTIVIVDDETGIIEEVQSFLTEEGYEVHSADNGKDGIDLIARVKPDVLILDMKLPDMSGINVLKACKVTSPTTKVIVNTGYVDQNIIDEAERIGREAFLQKPFNLERLLSEIEVILGIKPKP